MKPTTLTAIKAHAIRDYPREACGLVVVVRGRERYVPCANTAPGDNHFRLAPDDYAAAEALGEITIVVHSHPDASPEPSEADRVGCEASGLSWLIVGVAKNDQGEPETTIINSFAPSGYEAPLVGRTFHHGVLDCYTLIRDWYQRERGITLPDFERTDGWWERNENLYMKHFADAGFVRVDDDLLPGDVILMQVRSPHDANHAAVYLGDGLMLHHLYGRLSSRDVFGGYWQDCMRGVVRYYSPYK